MVIIETRIFTQCITTLMGDDEYRALQEALVTRPDMGLIVQGTGGLRKVRWHLKDRGKRAGVRVIYYWLSADEQLYMLYAYAKSDQTDLTATQRKLLKEIVENWADE